MITAHNFAPGNAGAIFYMDLIIPLFGYALLWFAKSHRSSVVGASQVSVPPCQL
jgi:hypothetical protein